MGCVKTVDEKFLLKYIKHEKSSTTMIKYEKFNNDKGKNFIAHAKILMTYTNSIHSD